MPVRVPVRAIRNGGLDFMEVPTKDEAIVAALLTERLGYERRGLTARVALVDKQLARYGHVPNPVATRQRR